MSRPALPASDVVAASTIAASRGIDLLQLQYFVEVARTLSIGEASRLLRVTQPSLTRQLGALESALNVELFHRGPKGLTLTEAGSTALTEFTGFLDEYERAVAEIASPRVRVRRPLRMGVPWWVSIAKSSALAQHLAASSHFSGIEFEVVASAAGADAVRAGQLDAAIVAAPVDEHDLASIVFHSVDSCALVPAQHPLAKLSAIPLAALADLPRFAMFSRQSNPLQYKWLRECHAANGFVPRRIVYVEDPASMIQLVASGQAAATFNAVAPRHLRLEGVAARPLAPRDALRAAVCLITLKSAAEHIPPAIVPALRELLVAHRETAQPPPPAARLMS